MNKRREIDQASSNCDTALIIAARKGYVEIGNIALEHANRSLIDHIGAGNMTALMQAARRIPAKGKMAGDSPEVMARKTEIAKVLLQNGARLSCQNSFRKTALDLAENRDEFTDLIIENYDKKLFVRRDGDDLNYLKSLAEEYEKKGDYLRFLKLELLVENILQNFLTPVLILHQREKL